MTILLYAFLTLVVAGLLIFLLDRSPADDELKRWGRWVLIVVAVIVIIQLIWPILRLPAV